KAVERTHLRGSEAAALQWTDRQVTTFGAFRTKGAIAGPERCPSVSWGLFSGLVGQDTPRTPASNWLSGERTHLAKASLLKEAAERARQPRSFDSLVAPRPCIARHRQRQVWSTSNFVRRGSCVDGAPASSAKSA